jgi:hypothetical protein
LAADLVRRQVTVIVVQTARLLGIKFPSARLAVADEVIE